MIFATKYGMIMGVRKGGGHNGHLPTPWKLELRNKNFYLKLAA